MPSAKTAATPGASDTTCRDWGSSRFMAAPTSSRSSRAGSRWTTLSAVFLTASGISLAGICSAITSPSPYARISASMLANSSTACALAQPSRPARSSRCASSMTMTWRSPSRSPALARSRRYSTILTISVPMRKALS